MSKWLQVADAPAGALPLGWNAHGEGSPDSTNVGTSVEEEKPDPRRPRNVELFFNSAGRVEPVADAGRSRTAWLIALFAVWLVSGSALFFSMGFGPIEVLYIMSQIVTTVGYGDLIPETQMQKLACTGIVLVSTLLIANLIMVAIDAMLDAQAALLSENMSRKEEEILRGQERKARRARTERMRTLSLAQLARAETRSKRMSKLSRLALHGGTFVLFVLAGTVFFALFEPCSCSYGRTRLEGCVHRECEETGGEVKTWIDALYMSVITLGTVGFGDSAPETLSGRAFATVWMLLGVGATFNFIGSFSDFVFNSKNQSSLDIMTKAMFYEHDADGDGYLSRAEFLKLALFQNGLATAQQFDSIMRQFDTLAGDDSRISMSEFAAYYLPDVQAELIGENCDDDHTGF